MSSSYTSAAPPAGSLILVTGTTGLLGSAIASSLLSLGHRIIAPIRNATKGSIIDAHFASLHPSQFTTVLIPDMTLAGVFDGVMNGVSGVVHVASDLSFSSDPEKVIGGSVRWVEGLLGSAQRAGVGRVVLTSSAATLPSFAEEGVVTGASWRDDADALVGRAWSGEGSAMDVLVASKILCERAVWGFARGDGGSFGVNTVLPGLVLGKPVLKGSVGSSNALIMGFLKGDEGAAAFLKAVLPGGVVGLDDVVRLHVIALLGEEVGRRILAVGEGVGMGRLVGVLGVVCPGWGKGGEWGKEGEGGDMGEEKAKAMIDLRWEVEALRGVGREGFVGFEEVVRECVEGFEGVV